jgi:hypothetical protein
MGFRPRKRLQTIARFKRHHRSFFSPHSVAIRRRPSRSKRKAFTVLIYTACDFPAYVVVKFVFSFLVAASPR